MIPVSTTNAYVGSNLFLSEQMEKSPELYHFIESRGAPHAIRLNERPNRAPELILFYPREDALYIAEISATKSNYNWIIRGPHRIPRYDATTLNQPAIDIKGEPLLILFERQLRFPPTVPQTSLRTVAVAKLPEAKSLTKPAAAKSHTRTSKSGSRSAHSKAAAGSTSKTQGGTASTNQPAFKPLNTDQMAILMSQGFAERDKNGDLIHTVKSDAETIDDIAKWYTNDAKSGELILKATGLEGVKTITKGLRVRVPFTLIKNTKQMPEK